MTISAQQVKDLREKTGAGMMDCKKALAETNGDFEAAVDFLRKKGLAASAKKAGRTAAEGLIAIASNDNKAVLVELNSETDFVSRNEQFQALVTTIATIALGETTDIAGLNQAAYPDTGRNVEDEIKENIATIGENLVLRRADELSVNEGVVAQYIHSPVIDGLGKIGVLIAIESAGDKAKLHELGKQLAMHVAAAKPEALNTDDLDQEAVERERAIFADQAKASGKPENIIDKIVEGRLKKYYSEVVLLEQQYVIDGESKVSDVIENAAKDIGSPIKVTGFVRYTLGEGVEKEESDFAAEVAAAANN